MARDKSGHRESHDSTPTTKRLVYASQNEETPVTQPTNDLTHWRSQALAARKAAAGANDIRVRIRFDEEAARYERLVDEASARAALVRLRVAAPSGPACSAGWCAAPL
jgi:hypothetical protein